MTCFQSLGSLAFGRVFKTKKESLGIYLVRWFEYVQSLDASKLAVDSVQSSQKKQGKATKSDSKVTSKPEQIDSWWPELTVIQLNFQGKTSDQGKFEIGLTEAEMGKVVTRFPPEPSGYLHIGHAKAALMNQYFAETYKGKLIIRFDDTNPSKEKTEFEESIKEDLALIGVNSSVVTHSSDYFDQMYDLALKLIKEGKGYVDDTDQLTMRDQRMNCVASKCRDLPVEENLRRFEEMKNGTEFVSALGRNEPKRTSTLTFLSLLLGSHLLFTCQDQRQRPQRYPSWSRHLSLQLDPSPLHWWQVEGVSYLRFRLPHRRLFGRCDPCSSYQRIPRS